MKQSGKKQKKQPHKAQQELEASHRGLAAAMLGTEESSLLRAITDATDAMLVCLDPDFNFLWVNPAYARTCNRTPEELVGTNHFALYPHQENEQIFRQVRESGEPVIYKDKPFEFPDQPERGVTYWDWSLVPVKDAAGRVTALVFSLRETTKFKQAQLQLAESEERFRRMAETSTDIIFQLEPGGRVTYVSQAVRAFGYTPRQVQGRLFSDFILAADRDRADKAFARVIGGKNVVLLELLVLKADGSAAVCEISATPVTREGVVVGVQGTSRDITERKRTEEKIRRNNALLLGIKEIFEAGLVCETDEELAAAALQVAKRITGSRFGAIGEIGPDGQIHDLAASNPWRQCLVDGRRGNRLPPANLGIASLYDHVLAKGASFFINEPASDPVGVRIPEGQPPLTSFLGVPLVCGGLIGLIALANKDGGYSDEELESVQALASAFVESLSKFRVEKALRESEERERSNALQFKQFFDSTPIPVWIAHDPECRVVTGNLAAVRMLGVDPEANVARTAPGEKVPLPQVVRNGKELAPDEDPLHYAVTHGKRLDDREIDIVLPAGGTRHMLGTASPLLDAEGNVRGGIAAYMDITERKSMEEQLLRAKQEWEKTFDAVPDLITILDPHHRIVRVNRAMTQRMGMGPGQSIGRFCFTCVHKRSHPNEECPNTLTLRDGREHVAEVHEEWLGGDFLVTTTPIFDERGEIMATVHVARDVTQIKETARLLKESEERLNRAQRIAHLGSWELDVSQNVLTWSDEVFRIFGLEPQSFAPCYEDFLSAVHPEDRIKVHTAYGDSLREGNDGYEVEHRIIQKDTGKIRYVHEKCEHFRDEAGKVVRSGGMVHDITERKVAERKILILNRSLQHSIRQLAVSNQELERSNQDLQQYAYIISHDLQEPLRTVSSFVQLLSRRYRGKLDAKADTFINFAVEGAAHMQRLLTDLLLFSRVGGGELRMERVSLDSVLEKALLHLMSAIEESGAQVESESLPVVLADEIQLHTLLQNLVSNALKFRGENPPRIHVSSQREANEWIICVRDNGIGLDPRFADRIFLIFQRLHRRNEYSGTGIGLAICKKVVERHGGRIWVESTPGEGAAFKFSLPAVEGEE